MTTLQPFQPDARTAAQFAAVSCPPRYFGHGHTLYASNCVGWFAWCETNALEPVY